MKCYSFLLKSPPPSPASSFTKLNTASRSSPWPRTEWRQNKQQHQQRSLCPIIAPSQVATSSSHACRFESASRQWFAHRHRWPCEHDESTWALSWTQTTKSKIDAGRKWQPRSLSSPAKASALKMLEKVKEKIKKKAKVTVPEKIVLIKTRGHGSRTRYNDLTLYV